MSLKSLVWALVLATPAWAWNSVNLADYGLAARYLLPPIEASEASAVTYNWDTDTLFVLGDEGDALVEVRKDGSVVGSMTLTGFGDTEGLTYIGNGKFVLVEERLRDAYELTYAAGITVSRSSLPTVSLLEETADNFGLEGISFDPPSGRFLAVKEKSPQRVLEATIDFAAGTAFVTDPDPFSPDLGVLDLSDIQVLSVVPSLAGTPDADNLLIYSRSRPCSLRSRVRARC